MLKSKFHSNQHRVCLMWGSDLRASSRPSMSQDSLCYWLNCVGFSKEDFLFLMNEHICCQKREKKRRPQLSKDDFIIQSTVYLYCMHIYIYIYIYILYIYIYIEILGGLRITLSSHTTCDILHLISWLNIINLIKKHSCNNSQ